MHLMYIVHTLWSRDFEEPNAIWYLANELDSVRKLNQTRAKVFEDI